jgi:hypothetical protein
VKRCFGCTPSVLRCGGSSRPNAQVKVSAAPERCYGGWPERSR